jgi:hypothetical protein
MDSESPKLTTRSSVAFDLLLALMFFGFMSWVLRANVPMQGPGVVELLAAVTAFPMAIVFWILIQMFRVTLVDQLRRSRAASARLH